MPASGAAVYLADPSIRLLCEFFERKGLAAIKEEGRAETWYDDWIAYQTEHRLYAGLLSPAALSSSGGRFDLLQLVRFWEVASYFSPAHTYSLHVSFLGLFPILRSDNAALKQEAIARLDEGGLFAFGVSEQTHGADLLANEFSVAEISPGRLRATGSKHYIGNAQAAAMVAVLAKRERGAHAADSRRAPLLFFALRPGEPGAVTEMRKIRTLGIRAAYVAAFDVDGYEFPATDIVCEGRAAWESVFATVTLGKFFLGFGSVGICEHAYAETVAHTHARTLYGKPVTAMPHIRAAMVHAYAKLTAMKLFAYRALDYLQNSSATDRRYLLFTAVQKARVSSEGVKVMALLSECIGARGFEAETYFESALRDIPLVPTLEGSTHINHQTVALYTRAYFARRSLLAPGSPPSFRDDAQSPENTYLFGATLSDARLVSFAFCLNAYHPLKAIANVALFVRQVRLFRVFARRGALVLDPKADSEVIIALGKCLSVIAYAQLIAEHCKLADIPDAHVAVLFHQSIEDLGLEAARLASMPRSSEKTRRLLSQLMVLPRTRQQDLDQVAEMAFT